MENELLLKILQAQEATTAQLKEINQRLDKVDTRLDNLEAGQESIIKQQMKDSKLLQNVFDQTIKLTEHKAETDKKFNIIKSNL